MQELILIKGLPGSGKSMWAKDLMSKNPFKYKRVNKDLLREMVDFNEYSGKSEKYILKLRDNLILTALQNSFSVIVDDTNLNPLHETHIRDLVKTFKDLQFKVKFIDTPIKECISNDLRRLNSVGSEVIMDMYNKWLKPASVIVKHNPKLPYCIIVDIDGTVALKGDRKPFEWDKVGLDKPNTSIIDLVNAYIAETSNFLIFVSGRDECCRDETEKWLDDKLDYSYTLFMRPKDDFRKDIIIKREIYENEILNKYNVDFVLDDRNCVVEQWRDMGLTCLQVAEGNF